LTPAEPTTIAPTENATPAAEPRRMLGLLHAVTLIVGLVLGAGIFKAPSLVAGNAGSVEWMFAAWVLGGVISLIGALCYAELATAYPHAGGEYHFLRRAYGRGPAFLFGWARFTVIVTGSIALLAFVYGDYMNQVVPLDVGNVPGSSIHAALAVVALSWLNLRNTRTGANAQTWLTFLEVGGLLLVAASALFLVGQPAPPAAPATTPSASAFGLAMVFVLLTYGGWNEAPCISAELKDVRRNMVKALTLSIALITFIYLVVTWSYWRGLGMAGMASSEAVAVDLLAKTIGPAAGKLIALVVAVTALTSINATMMVGARSSYALGLDWPALRTFAAWDVQRDAPANALRIQCIVALLLVALGTWTGSGFKSMVEFTAPVFWLFFMLAGASLFVLRHREPQVERPFRVPLYPLLPFLFCSTCAYMLWSSLSYVYSQKLGGINAAWIGVAVLALGLVVLAALHSARSRSPALSSSD
jgi:amino acid transporter